LGYPLSFYPLKKCRFIDQYTASNASNYAIKTVLFGVENQMTQATYWWPGMIPRPVGCGYQASRNITVHFGSFLYLALSDNRLALEILSQGKKGTAIHIAQK